MSNTISDDNREQPNKKQKSKWKTSYSKVTQADAEKRLGFRMRQISTVPIQTMLAEAKYESTGSVSNTKEAVYKEIVKYLDVEDFPTGADEEFNESSINDLVYSIIGTILFDLRRETGRKEMKLRREREITAVDSETGGPEEFVVMDYISVSEERFVLVVEAKRYSVGQATRQCLLSMKDMWDNNDGGIVYGFVTTGEHWQMVRYDGTEFRKTRNITALFEGMDGDPVLWMKDCSIIVDCIEAALRNGGIVKKDVVAG